MTSLSFVIFINLYYGHNVFSIEIGMLQSDELAHLSKVYSVIAGACIRIFHCKLNQRTNGPVNAHLISWPTKAQNIQNLENI